MMGAISVVVVRYRLTLFAALAFLAFVAFRIHSVATATGDYLSPFLIAAGLVVMHQSSQNETLGWLYPCLYWLGESLVIAMFTYNSVNTVQKPTLLYLVIALFSMLAALWFRGKFWNYILVLGLELFMGIFIAMAFPIMEMVLEAILNDKLKKVGDKVRAHHQHLERYYNAKR
jgi:multisubunit Na+/H+ antiporter MnhG subunit